jgi:acetylornithine/N-succinyldiaminopimelate aminotransferase
MAPAPIPEAATRHLLNNYRRQPVLFVRGQGLSLWDSEGREYLDMLGGIATCALGHCHPDVVAAVKRQADRLWHVSNLFYTEPSIELAERLCEATGLARAFFCNSGAEANETLIKLARKVQHDRGEKRFEIICAQNSFHGRTLGALSATGQAKYHKGFEPMLPGMVHVPYGDLAAVASAITERTAAVLVEPIQGEGGVRVAPPGFLEGLRALCDRCGLLFMLDEVQTGMGRTGTLFAFQAEGVRPDAISLAKALGNGIPIGAMLCTEEAGRALGPGTHASTFGGNLLAAAAACATFDIVNRPETLANCRAMGERLIGLLRRLASELPEKVRDVRGRGLLVGVELSFEATKAVTRCRELGLIINAASETVARFAPALIVTEAQIDQAFALFSQALRDA